MIILITGTPGSGKTLFAVHKIVNQYLSTDRSIYSDIDGLNIEGVDTPPDDWRDTPEGSVIIYDEAQQRDIFKCQRSKQSDIVEALQVHRHTGHDIIFITQSPRFLNMYVLDLVGEHYHLHRPYGASLASIYFWRSCQKNPQSKTAQKYVENESLFKYKSDLYKYYKSATVHTHKLAIPKKIILWCLAPFLMLALIWHFVSDPSTKKMIDGGRGKPVAQSTSTQNSGSVSPVGTTGDNLATDQSAVEAHELTRPAQIVSSSAGDCYAKNSYGELLDISADKCNLYAEHPNLLSGSRIAPSVQSRPSDQNLASSQVAYTNPVPTQQSQL
jgi:hypothetical protein